MAVFRVALAVSLLPLCLAAQQPSADTTGFRSGQWGVQFGAGFGLANLGILKFTSARSAWMLLFDVSMESLKGTYTAVGTAADAKDRTLFFATGIGRRFYQEPRHNVRSFQSIGLIGSYNKQEQTITTTTYSFMTWRAGVLGELGAGYWVTPNLSLGGTANITGGFSRRHVDGGTSETKEKGWFVSGVNVLLTFGLYF